MKRTIIVSAHMTPEKIDYLERLDGYLNQFQYHLFLVNLNTQSLQTVCEHINLVTDLEEHTEGIQDLLKGENFLTELFLGATMEADLRNTEFPTAVKVMIQYAKSIQNLLQKKKPCLCVLWHQFSGIHRVWVAMCRALDIAYVFGHLGPLPGMILFEQGGQMAESWVAQQSDTFLSLPVSKNDLASTQRYISYVKQQKLTRKPQAVEGLIKETIHKSRQQNRKFIFYAGQNDYQSGLWPSWLPEARLHSPLFTHTLDGLQYLARLTKTNNWQIIFKPHPNIRTRQDSFHGIHFDHVDFVVGANIFECIYEADLTVTIFSQVSYLALIHERPLLLLGKSQLSGKGCAYEVASREEIEPVIHKALQYGVTEEQLQNRFNHIAQICKYYAFSYKTDIANIIGRDVDEAAQFLISNSRFPIALYSNEVKRELTRVTNVESEPHNEQDLPLSTDAELEGWKETNRMKEAIKKVVIKSILSSDRLFSILRALLFDDRVYNKVLTDELLEKRVFFDDRALQKLLTSNPAFTKILANDQLLDKLLTSNQAFTKILANDQLLDKLLTSNQAFTKILANDQLLDKLLASNQAFTKILANNQLLDKLLASNQAFTKILVNDQLLDKLLNTNQIFNRILSNNEFLDKILFTSHVLGNMELLDKLLTTNHVFQRLLSNDDLLERVLSTRHTLEKIPANDSLLNKILIDERSIKKILLDRNLKSKVRYVHANQKAAKLNYSLPTFLVSFPRSGSNFLQNVLQGSSGLRCQSIYAPLPDNSEPVLSFKSHAVSLEHLLDEVNRLLPEENSLSKVILLHRDPRDTIISFYEYTQSMRKVKLDQNDFLKVSYFYASTVDRNFERKLEYIPLDIAEAYKKHINNWFVRKDENLDCLIVRYEDLVLSPEATFGQIFNFLELDCSLLSELLQVKVSLYSKKQTNRGQPQGWRQSQSLYADLLIQVEEILVDEIKSLGYESGAH